MLSSCLLPKGCMVDAHDVERARGLAVKAQPVEKHCRRHVVRLLCAVIHAGKAYCALFGYAAMIGVFERINYVLNQPVVISCHFAEVPAVGSVCRWIGISAPLG